MELLLCLLFCMGVKHGCSCRLKVCENRVLRRIFWPKRDEVQGRGENYILKSLTLYTPHQILFG